MPFSAPGAGCSVGQARRSTYGTAGTGRGVAGDRQQPRGIFPTTRHGTLAYTHLYCTKFHKSSSVEEKNSEKSLGLA